VKIVNQHVTFASKPVWMTLNMPRTCRDPWKALTPMTPPWWRP
jgi:hypothetical protein